MQQHQQHQQHQQDQQQQEGVRVEECSYGTSYIPCTQPKEARTQRKKRRRGEQQQDGGSSSSSDDDVDDNHVPSAPAYQAPINQYYQMVQQQQPMAPKFMFQSSTGHAMSVEFYPVCLQKGNSRLDISPRFEPFSSLICQANHWLSTHPTHRCLRCETVMRHATFDGSIDFADSHSRGSKFGSLVFVKGMRMWVTERSDIPQQQLWYVNVLPKPSPGAAEGGTPEFEDLRQTCDFVNLQFGVNPIPGTILNMEQMELLFQRWGSRKNIDLDKSYFMARQDKAKSFVIGLRIYYMIGQSLNEKIGIVSLLPQVTHRSGMQRPHVAPFADLVSKAAKWISQNQQNVRITDLQSFRLFVNIEGGDSRWKEWHESENPYRSFSTDRSHSVTSFAITTLRIIYTMGGPPYPLLTTGILSTRVFVPFKVGEQTYESVQQTCGRISTWMNIVKPRIISAETVEVFHQAAGDDVKHENCDVMYKKLTNHSSITCFRFFVDGTIVEPAPQALPPPPIRRSACCIVL